MRSVQGVAKARGDVRIWETANLEEHVALIKRQVEKSLADDETIQLARKIVSGRSEDGYVRAWGQRFRLPQLQRCPMRGPGTEEAVARCESTAIWNFTVANVRYVEDPSEYDLFGTARYILEAGAGDCFPEGTLLLRDDYALVPVEHIRAGDRIWGAQEWTRVEAAVAKGARGIAALRLNNGSTVRLTEDHKVYVVTCPRHASRVSSSPCACPTDQCRVERIRVAEVQPGMRLLQPERIAFGKEEGDLGRHYIEGLYVADGWNDSHRFAISGKDGHPKEAQKREVEAICKRLGIATRWHERYLAVNDPEWAERVKLMGAHAPQKRILSLDLAKDTAEQVLRGVMADSGANTNGQGRTFTTTSRELATQVRVLHRMMGTSCGFAYLENHGGLGTHPIYRLGARDGSRTQKILRVKDVMRGLPEEMTYDLQTYDHRVYLPEHDVTVSNCDDSTILLAALHKAVGFRNVRARVVSTDERYWEHVYVRVGVPKSRSRELIALDPTVKGAVPGWEYPRSRAIHDFLL